MAEELTPQDLEQTLGVEVEENPELAEATPEMLEQTLSGIGAQSTTRRPQVSGQLASLRGDSTSLVELAKADVEINNEAILAVEANAVYDAMNEELGGVAERALIDRGMDPALVAEQLIGANKQIEELRASPISQEWAVLKQASVQPLDPDLHREIALSFAMTNTLAKLSDEMGVGDYVADIFPLIIPFRETVAWEQVKAGIRGQSLLNNYVTGNDIEGMITSWQGLEIARKEILYPVLVQTILESLSLTTPPLFGSAKMEPNTLLAITMLLRFFQPEGGRRASRDQKLFAAVDALDVGLGSIAAAVRIDKAAKAAAAARFRGKPTVEVPVPVDASIASAAERFAPEPVIDVQGQAKAVGRAARKEAQRAGVSRKAARDIGKQARKDERARLIRELPQPVRLEMEAIMLNATARAIRENTIPHLLARAGNRRVAADINLSAMTTPEVAKAYGIHSDDAIDNVMPFQTRDWMPQVIEGLVPETAAKINQFMMQAERKVRTMTNESDLLRFGVLDAPERVRVVRNFLSQMDRVGEDMLMEGITLSDVRVLDETIDSFTFEYTITRTTDDLPETFTGRRSWRVKDATGNYTETVLANVEPTASNIPGLSPSAASVTKAGTLKDFNDTFKEAHILQDIEVSAIARINELWLDANRLLGGLGKQRARARVDAVELAGDEFVNPDIAERGKVFSVRELAAGIHVKGKKGEDTLVYLTDPKEVEAYYKRRLVSDAFSGMQNWVTRRELEVLGFKLINVKVGEKSIPLIARPFEQARNAKAALRNKKGFEAYDGVTGRVVSLDNNLVDEMYDRGMVLTRLQEDWNVTGNAQMLGGRHVEFVFTSRQGVVTLPQQVVHYKQGYVPKISEGVEFVVRQKFSYKKAGAIDGTKIRALRAFASKQDADTFIKLMATKLAGKTGITLEQALLRFDRADGSVMAQVERMQNNMSGSNGLFTGIRAQDDLLMGLDGVDITRMSPGEAYGRYVDHLGTQVSKNEWRMAKEQQWINTARLEFPELRQRITGFSIRDIPSDTEKGKALIRLHKQIQQWNRVPGRKESLYQSQIQHLNDWMLNGLNKVPGVQLNALPNFMNFKHTQATNGAMTASMHLLLGSLTMSQLFVQSISSVIALSLRPIRETPGIIRDAFRFGYFDNIRNEGVLSTIAKKLGRATDEDIKLTGRDLDMYRAWDRSGQRESVRSNADMNYMASTGLGMTANMMRKAGNGSLYLYRTGELVNRRVSFISAYSWAEGKFPRLNRKSDEFLEQVLKRSNVTMLELNAANKAWWQGGRGANAGQKLLQMTTQFLQIAAKTTELILKGEKRGGFSLREKTRIALGQTVMFGSAGVPPLAWFGTEVVGILADAMGLDRNDAEDVQTIQIIATAYNQGMIGTIATTFMGADVKVSSRLSIAANIVDTAWDILASEDPLMLKLLGVSGVGGERIYSAYGDVSATLRLATSKTLEAMAELEPYALADRRNTEPLTGGEMLAVAKSLGAALASIPSSTRGLFKAYIMQQHHIILSNKGHILVADDFNLATEIAVAMGFQTNREVALRVVTLDRKNFDDIVRNASDIIVRQYHQLAFLHNNDPDYASLVTKQVMFIQERMGNDWLVESLRKSLQARLRDNPQTKEERELAGFFERHMDGPLTQGIMADLGPLNEITGQAPVVLPFVNIIKPEGEE